MSVTTVFAGSLFPSPGTIHIIGTVTAAGVYIYKNDLGTMAGGDIVELRIGDQLAQGGTISLLYSGAYANIQATQIKISPPIPVTTRANFSLKMTAGSPRWFYFEVISI